jgi:hypothetical protein
MYTGIPSYIWHREMAGARPVNGRRMGRRYLVNCGPSGIVSMTTSLT